MAFFCRGGAVTVFENRLADLGVDVAGTYNGDLVLFLYSGEMAIIMKENKLKIHADSGEIIENFYEFLRFQLDETRKTIQTVLQHSGSFEGFKDYLLYCQKILRIRPFAKFS